MRSVLMRTEIQFAVKKNEFDAETIRLMLRTIEAPSITEADDAVMDGSKRVEYIDAGALRRTQLVLRPWQPGDRFAPLGMRERPLHGRHGHV